jgi:hypothetical protein
MKYTFRDEKLKMMVYGNPGVGKTRMVATAAWDPRLAPALMLEAKGNPISIRAYDKKPDIVVIKEMADFNDPYAWMSLGQPADHPFAVVNELHPPYKTVIVDSLTEVQRLVIRKVQHLDSSEPGNLTPALGRQGFGQLLGTMLNWATFYLELDLNVIITSHEAQKQDESQIIHKMPLIWGQSGNELPGYCYMVMRLIPGRTADAWMRTWPTDPLTDATQTVGLLKETTQYYAKDQYGVLTDHICDPTMAKVVDLIEQSGQPNN